MEGERVIGNVPQDLAGVSRCGGFRGRGRMKAAGKRREAGFVLVSDKSSQADKSNSHHGPY